MPYDDPRWMGGIGMIGTRAVYDAVMNCDLLLMVGTDYPYSEFLPRQDRGRSDRRAGGGAGPARADRARRRRLGAADAAAAARARCRPRPTAGSSDTRRQGAAQVGRDAGRQADLARSTDRIHPQAVARMVSDLAEPRCGLRPRHRAQHALVRQLDPAERIAAHHRLVQQRRGRHRARPGQRRPGAGPLAPGDRADAATAASTC